MGVDFGGKGSKVDETPFLGVGATRPEADRGLGDLDKGEASCFWALTPHV